MVSPKVTPRNLGVGLNAREIRQEKLGLKVSLEVIRGKKGHFTFFGIEGETPTLRPFF